MKKQWSGKEDFSHFQRFQKLEKLNLSRYEYKIFDSSITSHHLHQLHVQIEHFEYM